MISPAKRAAVVEMAEREGNVAEVCRREGIDRTTFYKLRARVKGLPRAQWVQALGDRPRRWRTHGQQTTKTEKAIICKLALEHPAWGCSRLSAELGRRKIVRSHTTVQKVLKAASLDSPRSRWLALDTQGATLTLEQRRFIEAENPAFSDRRVRAARPKAMLFADCVLLDKCIPGQRSVRLFVIVDSYSSRAFATLAGETERDRWMALLEGSVETWIANRLERGRSVAIEGRKGAFGKQSSDVNSYLRRKGVTAEPADVRRGSIERFALAVGQQFSSSDLCNEPFAEMAAAREAFQEWLKVYNAAGIDGYPNYGLSPTDMVKAFIQRSSAKTLGRRRILRR